MSSDSLEPLDPEDPLDQLVDAYRAETAHRARDARVLRSRVITALGARRRAPRALVWLGAAAVLFAGSAALAAGGERTVTRLLALLRPQAAEPAAPAERDRAIRRARRGAAPTAPIPLPLPPANPVDTSPTVVPLSALPLVEPSAPAKGRPARPSPELSAPRADPGPDLGAELSLYQRAHALHFGGGPPAEALGAWRDYLHEHPRGALAAEARLNEAVCLVKLGRRREGRRILEALSTGNAPQSTERQASELLLTLGPESAR